MTAKTVPESVFYEFEKSLEGNELFSGISKELIELIRKGNATDNTVEKLLGASPRED